MDAVALVVEPLAALTAVGAVRDHDAYRRLVGKRHAAPALGHGDLNVDAYDREFWDAANSCHAQTLRRHRAIVPDIDKVLNF